MKRLTPVVLVALVVLVAPGVVACGGGQASAAAPAAPAAPASQPGALRLGHYSSGDGMLGFILDRSGPAPKLKMDGTSQVLVLEAKQEGRAGYTLVNHEQHIGISVDAYGGVIFSKKGAGPNKPVYWDGDAPAL